MYHLHIRAPLRILLSKILQPVEKTGRPLECHMHAENKRQKAKEMNIALKGIANAATYPFT
jgi:hypothetical protein